MNDGRVQKKIVCYNRIKIEELVGQKQDGGTIIEDIWILRVRTGRVMHKIETIGGNV